MEKSPSYIITNEEGTAIGRLIVTEIIDYEMKLGRLYKIPKGVKPPLFNTFPQDTEDKHIARELLALGGYFKKFGMEKEAGDDFKISL
jgi:hypothetical protein